MNAPMDKGGRWAKLAARAVADRNMTATHVRVLACLGIYAGPEGVAWPSQETMALVVGVNRATVCRAIKRAVALGYLDRYRKRPVAAGTATSTGCCTRPTRHRAPSVATPKCDPAVTCDVILRSLTM